MQASLSDKKKVISGHSSLSGPGLLSKFFKAVKGWVKGFPESADSWLPSPQSNPHVKVVHCGAAYSAPLLRQILLFLIDHNSTYRTSVPQPLLHHLPSEFLQQYFLYYYVILLSIFFYFFCTCVFIVIYYCITFITRQEFVNSLQTLKSPNEEENQQVKEERRAIRQTPNAARHHEYIINRSTA